MKRLPTIGRDAALAELQQDFPNAQTHALDATYTLVDDEFLRLWRYQFQRQLAAEEIGHSPAFDCDDFARLAISQASLLYMRRVRGGEFGGQGMAVGLLCFLEDGLPHKGHAVCVYRDAERWRVYDAAKDETRELTEKEKESGWLVVV